MEEYGSSDHQQHPLQEIRKRFGEPCAVGRRLFFFIREETWTNELLTLFEHKFHRLPQFSRSHGWY
jgi:hypothetical protein